MHYFSLVASHFIWVPMDKSMGVCEIGIILSLFCMSLEQQSRCGTVQVLFIHEKRFTIQHILPLRHGLSPPPAPHSDNGLTLSYDQAMRHTSCLDYA